MDSKQSQQLFIYHGVVIYNMYPFPNGHGGFAPAEKQGTEPGIKMQCTGEFLQYANCLCGKPSFEDVDAIFLGRTGTSGHEQSH